MIRALVLVVGGEESFGREQRLLLERLGHGVSAVVDAAERALAAVAQRRPDLVLVDARAPAQSLAAPRLAASLHERFELPSIIVGAADDDDTLERVAAVEGAAYLLAPCDPGQLQLTIRLLLLRVQARARAAAHAHGASQTAAVASFAERVVHDTNNLLSAIRVNAYVIRSQPEDLAGVREAADDIISAAQRGAQLTHELAGIAKQHAARSSTKRAPLDAPAVYPAAAVAALPTSQRTAAEPAAEPRATVLVVDDDRIVRRALSKALAKWGYRALDADGPERALALLAMQPVQLIVTDLRLARTSGYDLADQALRLQPSLQIVYMSGQALDSFPRRASQPSRAAAERFLQKPFDIDELRRTVEALLMPGSVTL